MGGMCEKHEAFIATDNTITCELCGEELVLITKKRFESLLTTDDHLEFLFSRGVDNWSGYGFPPQPEDYDTIEEYQQAWEDAVGDY